MRSHKQDIIFLEQQRNKKHEHEYVHTVSIKIMIMTRNCMELQGLAAKVNGQMQFKYLIRPLLLAVRESLCIFAGFWNWRCWSWGASWCNMGLCRVISVWNCAIHAMEVGRWAWACFIMFFDALSHIKNISNGQCDESKSFLKITYLVSSNAYACILDLL